MSHLRVIDRSWDEPEYPEPQQKECTLCGRTFSTEEMIHTFGIRKRADGGVDTIDIYYCGCDEETDNELEE